MNIEWREPITDRTQADIDYLRTLQQIGWQYMTQAQREEFKQDKKGALNRSDLERIKGNITIIQNLTNLHLINPPIPEIPRSSYYRQLLQDVTDIRNTRYHKQDTPLVPTGELNTFDKWNDIERILLDAYELIIINSISRIYCGNELYSGELISLL